MKFSSNCAGTDAALRGAVEKLGELS